MGLIEKLQSKLEIYRLEQRYAKRKNRATFTTGATYVDGEYVYDSGNASQPISASSTGSSTRNKRSSAWMGRR